MKSLLFFLDNSHPLTGTVIIVTVTVNREILVENLSLSAANYGAISVRNER